MLGVEPLITGLFISRNPYAIPNDEILVSLEMLLLNTPPQHPPYMTLKVLFLVLNLSPLILHPEF